MNPRIKRLLSMLLALTLVFSLFTPITASAASTTAVSDNTVEIEVGETAKLKVPSWYSKTAWTSSNEAVATVSRDGTVTGVAAGTATITATSRKFFGFGREQITNYTIIVTEPEEVESLTIKIGEKLQLNLDVRGNKVTWSSSDKKIATVNRKGVVTGISEGDVTITATIKKNISKGWFFGWGGNKATTTQTFEITVVSDDTQPTEPEAPTEPGKPGHQEKPDRPGRPGETTEPTVATYTVTFESNGGSEVEAQTIEEGMTVTEPEAPTLEGYNFVGWYADADLTEAYDFITAVTEDITLYAAWEVKSEADVYYESNSTVIDVIDAEESEDVPTETEVKALLEERGFDDYPITYDYSIQGTYSGDTEVTEGSTSRHPMYQTFYLSESGEAWVLYVINGSIYANPVSFNLESDLGVMLLISETETLTSYDDTSNKFYVTIPYETEMIVKIVDRIDAEILESLTIEEINKL